MEPPVPPIPETKPNNRNWKVILALASITIQLIIMGAYFLIKFQASPPPPSLTQNDAPVSGASPTPIPTPDINAQSLTFLLLGYGGAGHQGGYLTDVIEVIHFNFQKNVLAFIAIPRDLYLTYPDGTSRKVNAAYALKTDQVSYPTQDLDASTAKTAATLPKSIATAITGLPVHYFIGIDFVGFQRAIGGLGGLDVAVKTAIHDPWYPTAGKELDLCGHTPETVTAMTATMSGFTLEKQFPCRYETVAYTVGTHHMDGGDALKFVRSRHSSSDFAGGERAQAVLEALKDKLISLGALDDLPGFFQDLAAHTTTDLDADAVAYLAPTLASLPQLKVVNLGLTTANVLQGGSSAQGASVLIPKSGQDNWASVHAFIQQSLP